MTDPEEAIEPTKNPAALLRGPTVTIALTDWRELQYWATIGRAYAERDAYFMRGGNFQ